MDNKKNLYHIFVFLTFATLQPAAYCVSIKHIATLGICISSSALVGRYLNKPDTAVIPLEQFPITTFLPVEKSDVITSAQTEADSIEVIKKGTGYISVNDTIYQVSRGIPDDIIYVTQPITLFATGFNPFEMFSSKKSITGERCYTALKNGSISGPCIAYDTPYQKRKNFNFNKAQEIQAFEEIYQAIINRKKDAQIIIHAICKGANTALQFLNDKKVEDVPHIKAIVLQSPLLSFKHILKTIRLDSMIIRSVIRTVLYPNLTIEQTTIPKLQLPQIPLLIGILPKDGITNHEDVIHFFNSLKQSEHTELFTSKREDLAHAHIEEDNEFIEKIELFLKKELLTQTMI